MKEMRNAINKWGFSILAALMLLCMVFGASAEGTTVPLSDYATLTPALYADSSKTDLPDYVENGQSLFFSLSISDANSIALVNKLKEGGTVDFTVPIDFIDKMEGNYPTNFAGDSSSSEIPVDNLAIDPETDEPLFRWWIEGDFVKIRFVDSWVQAASSNTVLNDCSISFDGMLNVQNKPDNGKIVFKAAGEAFPLQMKAGYTLSKTAETPDYQNGRHVVDFTVKFTLDQKMNITGANGYDGYSALLTLVDTLNANSAMTGQIVNGPSITGATGLTVTASQNGTTNTFALGGVTELPKGTYTISFTMEISDAAANAKLNGYDKVNTVELKENNASLTDPLKATVTIKWDDNVSSRQKIDKCIVPQAGNTNLYVENDKYYADYYIAVYLRDEAATFTVEDTLSNAAHTAEEKPVTLMGVNSADNFWNVGATNISGLSQLPDGASLTTNIDGGKKTITLTAPAGQMLAPGAYYLKLTADVTDTVKKLMTSLNGDNTSAKEEYTNQAALVSIDDKVKTDVSPPGEGYHQCTHKGQQGGRH